MQHSRIGAVKNRPCHNVDCYGSTLMPALQNCLFNVFSCLPYRVLLARQLRVNPRWHALDILSCVVTSSGLGMDEGWLNSDVIVPYMCEARSYKQDEQILSAKLINTLSINRALHKN